MDAKHILLLECRIRQNKKNDEEINHVQADYWQ